MVCLSRPYSFNFFKGCLPQVLLGRFLNTLSVPFSQLHLCECLKWKCSFKSSENCDQYVFLRHLAFLIRHIVTFTVANAILRNNLHFFFFISCNFSGHAYCDYFWWLRSFAYQNIIATITEPCIFSSVWYWYLVDLK